MRSNILEGLVAMIMLATGFVLMLIQFFFILALWILPYLIATILVVVFLMYLGYL